MSTRVPLTGPKIAPFMIARASVTENGADATTHEDRDRKRIGERTDRSDLVGDPRLVTNHQEREHERGGEQRESGTPTKETIQAMVIRGGHHVAVRCWALRLAFHAEQEPARRAR